jgi:23S rRNA (uridine2479-2'-O)-methyltransferase
VGPDLLAAVIDRPANPGNLGTLIRSCDAFGVNGLFVSGHAVDVYDSATITASRGSLFAMPVVRVGSPAEVAAWLSAVRTRLPECRAVAADEGADQDLFSHDFTAPTVAVFGNEGQGLSRAYRELCDAHVRIPMSGSATSLNVGVAASIVLYEARRQRQAVSTGASSRAMTTS